MKNRVPSYFIFSFCFMIAINGCAQNQNPVAKIEQKGVNKNSDVHPPTVDTKQFFGTYEQMPRYPACEDQDLNKGDLEECAEKAMLSFIYKNLVYQEQAKMKCIERMALIQFQIEIDGSLTNLKLLRDLDEGCGKAALEIVKKMQTKARWWISGKQFGKVVKVQYTLPIRFTLS